MHVAKGWPWSLDLGIAAMEMKAGDDMFQGPIIF